MRHSEIANIWPYRALGIANLALRQRCKFCCGFDSGGDSRVHCGFRHHVHCFVLCLLILGRLGCLFLLLFFLVVVVFLVLGYIFLLLFLVVIVVVVPLVLGTLGLFVFGLLIVLVVLFLLVVLVF